MKNIFYLVALLLSLKAFSQTGMTNYGQVIFVEGGATLHIPGYYADSSEMSNAGMRLAGTLELGGDLINARKKNSFLGNLLSDDGSAGYIVFNGEGNQSIKGAPVAVSTGQTNDRGATNVTLLRNVIVEKPTGTSLFIDSDVQEINNFELSESNRANVVLRDGDMFFHDFYNTVVNYVDESVSLPTTGDPITPTLVEKSGIVTSVTGGGQLIGYKKILIDKADTTFNPKGFGIGLEFIDEAFVDSLKIIRSHEKISSITNGFSVLKSYDVAAKIKGEIALKGLDFYLSDLEGLGVDLSKLSVFVTDTMKVEWRKLEDLGFASSIELVGNKKRIRYSQLDPNPIDSIFYLKDKHTYRFALGETLCNVQPKFQFTSLSTDPDRDDIDPLDDGMVFESCMAAGGIGEEMKISLQGVGGHEFGHAYWMSEFEVKEDSIWSDTVTFNLANGAFNNRDIGTSETFWVKAISTKGCPDTLSFSTNYRQYPTEPVFDYTVTHSAGSRSGPKTVCTGNTVEFTNSSMKEDGKKDSDFEVITYHWDYGDVTDEFVNDRSEIVDHIYPSFDYDDFTNNDFETTLTVTTGYGCRSELTKTINVLPRPVYDFSINNYRADQWVCEHDDVQILTNITDSIYDDTPGYGSSRKWIWDYGYYTKDGDYPRDTVDLWSFEESDEALVDNTYTYEYIAPKNDTLVRLRMEFEKSGCWSEVKKPISIKPTPDALFGPLFLREPDSTICVEETFDFDNLSTLDVISGDEEVMMYNWYFGDKTFEESKPESTEEFPRKFYTDDSQPSDLGNDMYRVMLKVESSKYQCTHWDTVDVKIYPKPTGGFVLENPDRCIGEKVEFTNNSAIEAFDANSNLKFEWNFGDLSEIRKNSIAGGSWSTVHHEYTNPGLYTVSLKRTSDFGCTNTETTTHEIHALPEPSFIADPVCEDELYTIRNTSSVPKDQDEITGYEWEIESQPGLQNTKDATATFNSYGTYDIKLTVETEYGCKESTTGKVMVDRKPSFTLDPIISCAEVMTIDPQLDPISYLPTGTSFEWYDKDDALLNSGNTDKPELTGLTKSGFYTVDMSRSDGQYCKNSQDVQVIALSAEVSLGDKTVLTFCEEGILKASVRTDFAHINNTYRWFKDGSLISSASGPELKVDKPGTYRVEATSDYGSDQCISVDEVQVLINVPLSLALSDIRVCPGLKGELSLDVLGATYEWRKVGNATILSTANKLEVSEAGHYEATVSKDECTSTVVAEVVYDKSPFVDFTTNTLGYCVDNKIDFKNQSYTTESGTTIIGFEWLWDDGTTSTERNPSFVFENEGLHDVKLKVQTSNLCFDSTTNQVEIFTLPSSDFSVSDFCRNVAGEFKGNQLAGMDNFWEFGDGLRESGDIVYHQYSIAKDYTVSLTTTSDQGCQSQTTKTVTALEIPKFSTKGEIATCASEVTINAGNVGSTYIWKDAVGTSIGVSQLKTIDTNGNYSVQITDANACAITESFDVVLNTAIEPDLGPNRKVCGDITLDAGYYAGATYAWSTGVNTQTLEVTKPGLYAVDIIDANGCIGSDEVLIEWLDSPIVDLGEDLRICPGNDIQLHARNTGSTFKWSTGESSQKIRVSSLGIYSVEVTNANGCTATDEIKVNYFAEPVANFQVVENCTGKGVEFKDLSLNNGEVLTYQWQFDDGASASIPNPTHIFTSSSDHTARLEVVSENGCSDDYTGSFKVHPLPNVNFVVEPICQGDDFTFTNLSTMDDDTDMSFFWDLSGGNLSTVESPSRSFDVDGIYSIHLNAISDFGCVSDKTKSLTVNEIPDVLLPERLKTCDPELVLDAGNLGATYSWNTLETSQTIKVSTAGNYEVEVINAHGCSITQDIDVEFYHIPQLALGDDFRNCGPTELKATMTNVYYKWSTGENTPIINVSSSELYTLTVSNDEFCNTSDDIFVTIDEAPESSLPVKIEVCSNEMAELDAFTTSAASYLWSTGASTPKISTNIPGEYSVKLVSTDGCENTEKVILETKAVPVIQIEDQVAGCDDIELNPGAIGREYKWSSGTNGYFETFSESGIYSVEVVGENGCVERKDFDLSISDSPIIDLGDNQQICYGATTILYAGQEGIYDYKWSDKSTNNFLEVGSTGLYSVIAYNDEGCSTESSVEVSMRDEIALDLGEDYYVCKNEQVVLDAGIDGLEYNWSSDHGESSNEKSFVPEELGTFYLTVFDDLGCVNYDQLTITPTTNDITASFLSASFGDVGDTIQFAQLTESLNATYEWFFGDGSRSTKQNPDHIYFREGEFDVTLIASNEVCSDTLTKVISIVSGRLEGDDDVYVPLFSSIEDLDLYPNPTTEYIDVHFKLTKEETVSLLINDMSGYIAHKEDVLLKDETLRFDVSRLSSGVYFLTAATPGSLKRVKFIIER
ncbi:PKD domain-containing protein [Reichenbachiella versicolor]|uniref:PKD domain-containing protein n=1 Tax=Reichenbachiella versicolor TaxID=1821036 RepID=UPI0013A56E65|nr:PKD domain-containing protein [Reichenbachiella versicolor]